MNHAARDRRLRWGTGIYRVLLFSYPSSFRQEFGTEMPRVFRDRLRIELGEGDHMTLARFFARIGTDWLTTARRPQRRHRRWWRTMFHTLTEEINRNSTSISQLGRASRPSCSPMGAGAPRREVMTPISSPTRHRRHHGPAKYELRSLLTIGTAAGDGSLLVSDDSGNRTWKITAALGSTPAPAHQ